MQKKLLQNRQKQSRRTVLKDKLIILKQIKTEIDNIFLEIHPTTSGKKARLIYRQN